MNFDFVRCLFFAARCKTHLRILAVNRNGCFRTSFAPQYAPNFSQRGGDALRETPDRGKMARQGSKASC